MVTKPTFLRVPDLSNGTGRLTQHPAVALDQTVARWLREGHPALTLEVTQTQPLALLYLRRSSHFLMAPSASHSVVSL